MIRPYKNRTIDPTLPVEVYRNLHRKLLSIRQANLVVGHAKQLSLENVLFIVNEKQRDRARREQVRNVHAFVKGTLLPEHFSVNHERFPNIDRIFYQPYLYDSFVDSDGKRVDGAPYVYIEADGGMLIHY